MARDWKQLAGVVLLFTALSGLLYFNSARHEYHLDSGHSVRDNPALRDLNLIPQYFRDPTTFSILLTNIDYRPVLQVSYALNYRFFGYDMPGWHWTNILLHACCGVFLYLLALQFARAEFDPQTPWPHYAAFLTALLFIVNPVSSGVVNYLSARSSQLTAVFLLPSFLLCLKGRHGLANLLFLLALFTKVEAVAAFAVYGALLLWQRLPVKTWRELPWKAMAIYGLSSVFYLIVRVWVMSDLPFAQSAGRPGMNGWHYLITQVTAWWYYLLCWLSPLKLVADNQAYPAIYSPFHHLVIAALLAWLGVCIWLYRSWPTRPYRAILAVSGLALISPSSSVVPLAEMVNEHRPYLPVALLSMLWLFPLVAWFKSWKARSARVAGLVVLAFWLGSLGYLTVQRNKVFLTAESYWQDVLDKAPSPRAYVNYGVILLGEGRSAEALAHFQSSLAKAPNYHVAHINAALALSRMGRHQEAETHYNQAVAASRGDGVPYLWRARDFIETGRYEEALKDLQSAEKESNDKANIYLVRARALAWLNRGGEAAEWTLKAGELDFEKLGTSIVEVANPFFRDKETATQGVMFFNLLLERWSGVWWLHQNRGDLLLKLGKDAEAQKDLDRARALKP